MAAVDTFSVSPDEKLARELRLGIEIRNRSSMKRIYKNCFVASDAVTFLVKAGHAPSRDAAVTRCRELANKGLLRHVSSTNTFPFKDANLYYRFQQDEEQNNALLREVSLGTAANSGVGTGKDWGFAPHTAHNSLVLDLVFAQRLERDLQATADLATRAAALKALRDRVRAEVNPQSPGWDSMRTTTINGTRSRVWTRARPRGDFTNLKTEGAINVSPEEFLRTFLDFSKRKKWDSMGTESDGTIVEAVYTRPNASRPPSPPTPPPPPPPPLVADGNGRTQSGGSILGESDNAADDDSSSVSGSSVVENDETHNGAAGSPTAAVAVSNEGGSFSESDGSTSRPAFTSLRPPVAWGDVDLSACPENMSIANFQDNKLQETLQHLQVRMHASPVDECMICSKLFRQHGTPDVHTCPSCSRICCSFCCSKRVFEVHLQDQLRVCFHCYQESSRIKHPVGTLAYVTSVGQQTMEFLSMAEIRNQYEAEAAALGKIEESAEEAERPTVVAMHGVLPEDLPGPNSDGGSDGGSGGGGNGGGNDDDDDGIDVLEDGDAEERYSLQALIGGGSGAMAAENIGGTEEGDLDKVSIAAHGKRPTKTGGVRFAPSADNGGQGGGELAKMLAMRKEKEKWATCKQCGARVERTVEGIERHFEICEAIGDASSTGMDTGSGGSNDNRRESTSEMSDHSSNDGASGSKSQQYAPNAVLLGGIPRLYPQSTLSESESNRLRNAEARIIFRTRHAANELFRPRQVCSFQDSFRDKDSGLCCVYEISVRHRRVTSESDNHVTAEVLFMAHAARPLRTQPEGLSSPRSSQSNATSNTAAILTVVSQVDAKSRSRWLTKAFSTEDCQLGGLDVLKELMTGEPVESLEIREEEATGKLAEANKSVSAAPSSATASSVPSVSLADFELLSVLGRGGFGKVMQVRHKATGNVYAMKIFKKRELRKRKQVERTKTEREILSAVNHPFIVRLSYAFQTAAKLYMVMDFVQGGDFFTFMRKFRKLKEPWVQLYISEIAMALQHLHEIDVVYRDLKPENVLMDATGHVKLTDFGLSRSFELRPENAAFLEEAKIGNSVDNRVGPTKKLTRSYCGTEQYMAPEMLLQRGHGRVVDWWCLGLLMHEMLTGRHPFQASSHYDTLRNMVTVEPVIDPRVSANARSLVRRLLVKDPIRRLGAQRGAWIELRPHPFFHNLDWDMVLARSVKPEYIPPMNNDADTDNFEKVFTNEKPVDSVVEQEKKKDSSIFSRKTWFAKSRKASSNEPANDEEEFAGFSYNGIEEAALGSPNSKNG